METKNLVDAIVQQKPSEIKDSINAIMTEKAFGRIASYKQELAKSMFVGDLDEGRRALPPGFKNKGWNRSLGKDPKKMTDSEYQQKLNSIVQKHKAKTPEEIATAAKRFEKKD